MTLTVEFFSAECKLCNRALSVLQSHFPAIEIQVHKQSD